MEIKYTGRHFQVDDRIKSFADSKLTKMTKFLEEPIELQLTLETEKRRQIAELLVVHRHGTLQATEEAMQMTDAIQAVADKVEKQARRSRKKHKDKKRRGPGLNHVESFWPLDVLDGASINTPEGPKVIRSSQLSIKPMTVDEAALGLDESKNEFVVFRDASTDKVTVLYRRQDGHFGLIAPEL